MTRRSCCHPRKKRKCKMRGQSSRQRLDWSREGRSAPTDQSTKTKWVRCRHGAPHHCHNPSLSLRSYLMLSSVPHNFFMPFCTCRIGNPEYYYTVFVRQYVKRRQMTVVTDFNSRGHCKQKPQPEPAPFLLANSHINHGGHARETQTILVTARCRKHTCPFLYLYLYLCVCLSDSMNYLVVWVVCVRCTTTKRECFSIRVCGAPRSIQATAHCFVSKNRLYLFVPSCFHLFSSFHWMRAYFVSFGQVLSL